MNNQSSRSFEDRLAVREQVPVLVAINGPSGSGKTYSSLRLATGIQSVTGGDIGVIDTETKRSLHYADKFKFRHLDFRAPYGSLDYLEAIRHFTAKGVRTVIVDSGSHEHEGVGGYLATHEEELQRLGGNQKMAFAAWVKPARLRRQLIDGILHEDINLIMCFRAKEKIKIEPGKDPRYLGWMPICGDDFQYEMTATALLYPGCKGVPIWNPSMPGEKAMTKLPEQFLGVLDDKQPLNETHGRRIAEWARGGAKPTSAPATEQTPVQQQDVLAGMGANFPTPPQWADWTLQERGANRAAGGVACLQAWWTALKKEERQTLASELDGWKQVALAKDGARAP